MIAATALAMLALSPAPALAQLQEEEPDVEDIARTPLQDLGIDREGIPVALTRAVDAPYASETLTSCNALAGEIAELDMALGADFDIALSEDSDISLGKVAKGVVGSFLPFRGIVREVSGAADRQREVNLAITAGMVRRGYLKGLGQQRGCDYPARPHPEAPAAE
jgi:N-acetylmuramic acid 6-phosphate (MurNAc-6-P) etherase